jgi:hypothetical protein
MYPQRAALEVTVQRAVLGVTVEAQPVRSAALEVSAALAVMVVLRQAVELWVSTPELFVTLRTLSPQLPQLAVRLESVVLEARRELQEM